MRPQTLVYRQFVRILHPCSYWARDNDVTRTEKSRASCQTLSQKQSGRGVVWERDYSTIGICGCGRKLLSSIFGKEPITSRFSYVISDFNRDFWFLLVISGFHWRFLPVSFIISDFDKITCMAYFNPETFLKKHDDFAMRVTTALTTHNVVNDSVQREPEWE